MSTTTKIIQTTDIPKIKGGLPFLGHMIPFAKNPFIFMKKVSDQAGEVAQFKIFNQRMILLTGNDASKLFYRSSDEQLDQSAAYKLMTPIFGKGIVFDAPIQKKNEQLKMLMPALRMNAMRQHSGKIITEVEDMISDWGDSGEINLVEAMKQLTINTATHCLLGKEFRYELTNEFSDIYRDLEKGVNAIAYSFPNLPIPSFRKRDKARVRLHELVHKIIEKREASNDKHTDMFQMLIDTRYKDGTQLSSNDIAGMLVAAIFAGHHTSSGTSAWVLLELLKNPFHMKEVTQELDSLLGSDGNVTFQNLRETPKLENTLKEVLRLHPPLIVLMRQVAEDLLFKNHQIKKGDMVWASPPVTHRMAHLFRNPEVFDPDRYTPGREEDKNLMAYQPFGGGKHKCSGNAFAMFQIKSIYSILLRKYTFEFVDTPDTYVDDYGEMIVQPKSPCRIRYKRRTADTFISKYGTAGDQQEASSQCPAAPSTKAQPATTTTEATTNPTFYISIDKQLCQGHAMCAGESPELFNVSNNVATATVASPSVSMLEKAQCAANHCPNAAIKITTDHSSK
ncbi:cytochrome P450 [Gammaproteobacteria bacterium 42_54_T18]|nr:cytochrome P450 [Gammaproteobacteria bacterium 42_54_T18]